MENTLLEDVGLTAAEAAVYLALLELDKTKSGAVIEKTGLQPSVVFHALHSLRAKGLLTSVKIGKHNRYAATSPTALRDLLEQRKARFEKSIASVASEKNSAGTGRC
jgi:sugar-specific transcriptional regulator TrmB